MAKKTLVLSEGEYGFTHNFNVKEEDNTDSNLTGYTGARLVIWDEVNSVAKLDITSNLTISSPQVQWAVQNGQTDFNGTFIGTLHLTGAGVLEKTYEFTVRVAKKRV